MKHTRYITEIAERVSTLHGGARLRA